MVGICDICLVTLGGGGGGVVRSELQCFKHYYEATRPLLTWFWFLYSSTQVAGKFPAEFGGFAAAFEGVFPSMPRSLPRAPSHISIPGPQIDLPFSASCNHYWGPETVPLQNQGGSLRISSVPQRCPTFAKSTRTAAHLLLSFMHSSNSTQL